jgi:hypothetical protein
MAKRGITEKDMQAARERTQAYIDAYSLREDRVSQIENGDVDAMTMSSIRRYVEALGGRLTLELEMPDGRKVLA